MAKKAASKTATVEPTETVPAIVSTDTLLTALTVPQAETPRVWPCLLGPTGCGKTARVRQLAATMGRRLVSPPLTQGLPEDFTGLPRVTASGYSWHLPPWALTAIKEPCLVFLDEIDKASEDHQKILLPLLHELELHGTPLHPDTIYVCAMNQPSASWQRTETGKALLARVVVVPVSPSISWLGEKHKVDLSGISFGEGYTFTPLAPSMRMVDWLLAFYASHPGQAPLCRHVGALALGASIADNLFDRYTEALRLTPQNVCEALNVDVSLLESLSVREVVNLASSACRWCEADTYKAVLKKVILEGTIEDGEEFFKVQSEYVTAALTESPNGIDLFGASSEEDVMKALRQAAEDIAAVWQAASK